jgi:L-alanine-DL-glutamate epimerase-like enolase superfamily enzyme
MGGAVRERIKAYANGWYTVERTPEMFHEAALRVVKRGYLALKLDPFGAGRYELTLDEQARAVDLVAAVRDAIGPERDIMLEMHGRFNPATAILMANKLEKFRLAWIEEPVPPENLSELKRVAERVSSRLRLANVAYYERIRPFRFIRLTLFSLIFLTSRANRPTAGSLRTCITCRCHVGGPVSTRGAACGSLYTEFYDTGTL